MASYDWMCFAGTEIINASRLSQMIAAGHGPQGITCQTCAPCPDLDRALGYDAAYNPADNPWFDPADPDSLDFAGLLVTSVTGLEPGPITRTVTQNASQGATLGQPVQAAPSIVVTGLLMAATCCASDYGLRWLRSVLQGACGGGCSGDDLVFLSCVPEFPDEDCGPVDFPAALAPYYRTFKNAACIAGPDVSQIIPRGCPGCYDCGITEVTFTLSAADPCVYRDPVRISTGSLDLQPTTGTCVEWIDNSLLDQDCSGDDSCSTAMNCATDPNCVDVSPPSMPTLTNPCVNDCLPAAQYGACIDIPAGTFPNTTQGTLVLSIFTGDLPMRNIQIKVWQNPLNLPADQLEDCAMCSVLAISYVAANSTLTIDGGARTATISCVGGTSVRANPYIASGTGSANFAYPNFAGCGEQFTVCITAAAPIDNSGATFTVDAITKEC